MYNFPHVFCPTLVKKKQEKNKHEMWRRVAERPHHKDEVRSGSIVTFRSAVGLHRETSISARAGCPAASAGQRASDRDDRCPQHTDGGLGVEELNNRPSVNRFLSPKIGRGR